MTDSQSKRHEQSLDGIRAVVTGADGFVGRRITQLGEAMGIRMTKPIHRMLTSESRESAFDVSDRKHVLDLIERERPNIIIHLAAVGVIAGTASDRRLFEVNVAGTAHVLEAAASLRETPIVVMAGTGFEYGRLESPAKESAAIKPVGAYAASKAAATYLAGIYSERLPVTVLRPFSVYGPGERPPRLLPYLIEETLANRAAALTCCEQVRDYTYVDDIAVAFWRAATASQRPHGVQVINLGSGRSIALREFVEIVATGLRARGLKPRFEFGAKPYRDGEPDTYVPDLTEMKKTLQWQPETTLEDGVRKTLEVFLARV